MAWTIIRDMPLPRRRGPRPTTTPTNPHTQLDQQPEGTEQREILASAAFDLAGVEERASAISVPGARALWLTGGAAGPPEAFMIGTEFAHFHPGADQSLHMVYAARDDLEREVVEGLVRASHACVRFRWTPTEVSRGVRPTAAGRRAHVRSGRRR